MKSKSPKRLKPSIKFDAIDPQQYLKYNMPFSCEDCSHFDSQTETCTLGYETKWHRKDFQKKSYELSGRMSLCRFQEID